MQGVGCRVGVFPVLGLRISGALGGVCSGLMPGVLAERSRLPFAMVEGGFPLF